jgi:hypothetical protein
MISAALFFIGFIVLMRIHQVAFERKINTALKEINENEISYLEKKTISFENGLEFNDFHHPYAYDLISLENIPFSKLK